MHKHQCGYASIEAAIFSIIVPLMVAGVAGWVWNIVKIVGSDFGQITGLLVMRIVGVFIPPLGAVMGFL